MNAILPRLGRQIGASKMLKACQATERKARAAVRCKCFAKLTRPVAPTMLSADDG